MAHKHYVKHQQFKALREIAGGDRLSSSIQKCKQFNNSSKLLDYGVEWAAEFPSDSLLRRIDTDKRWLDYVGCETGQVIWALLENEY